MLCENCKNAFTYPKPVLPDYSKGDFQARAGDAKKLTLFEDLPIEIHESYNAQLELIQENLPKGSTVLEIGGGEGIFLELVKKRGFDVELIEPSVTAANRAKKRGLTVYNGYFKNNELKKKYSLICLGHVLEHIDDPLTAIDEMKESLVANGFILLTQTNFKGFMPWFLKKKWYAWVPDQHFSHFSLEGLKYLANRSSLTIKGYRYSRLVHGPSIYHTFLKYTPFLQDQIHILFQAK
ncbi:MAG TPA: class I SAM-dependent methyltransferase [Chryseolinea sp.]|nr:class I SAM-dependent methyltransferase [Chryseolinea sp.]